MNEATNILEKTAFANTESLTSTVFCTD